jgi:hypothetical protein
VIGRRAVVLLGEAGMGKSTLAETFAATAARQGAVVARGWCTSAEAPRTGRGARYSTGWRRKQTTGAPATDSRFTGVDVLPIEHPFLAVLPAASTHWRVVGLGAFGEEALELSAELLGGR